MPASPTPRPTVLGLAVILALLPSACFNPMIMLETDDATSDASSTGSDADPSEGTASEPDGGSGDPLPVCGDGVVEGDEVCDDGTNDGSYGGCAPGCTALGPSCGDGLVNGDEPCDDGDALDGNGCNTNCLVSGSVLWTVTYDGEAHGIDIASSVTTDATGAVIVSATLDAGAEPSGWLRKYTPDGGSVWTLDVTSPAGPAVNGPVAALLDDDVVFGGSYGPNGPSQDAWIRRVSSVGELVWTQTYSSPQGGRDRILAVDIDADGNIYALIEEAQLPTDPSYRTLARKYTPDGTELWTKFHDAGTRGRFLSNDREGRFVVVGTQDNSGVDEIWIQQTTSDAADVWTQIITDADPIRPSALSVNATGEIAIATDTSPRLIRLDSDGNEGTSFAPQQDAPLLTISAVHLEDNGNVILGGALVTGDTTALGWLSKYDAIDTELWTNTYDGAFDVALSFDSTTSITTDAAGYVLATGRIHDSADSLSNVWVSKLAP